MELPRRSFPHSRLNCLTGSIHPELGLVCTDGDSLFIIETNKRFAEKKKLPAKLTAESKVSAVAWNASREEEGV